MTTISSLAVRLFAEDSGLTSVFSKAERTVSHFGSHIKQEFTEEATGLGGLQNQFGRMAGALGGMFSAVELGHLIKENVELGASMDLLSKKTGTSTNFLSEMQYAAKLTGVDFDAFSTSLSRMQNNLYLISQSKASTERLAAFGLQVENLLKLKPEEQFEAIGKALDGIADPTQRTALAMMLWGKAGAENLKLFENGSEGLKHYREEAHNLGLTITKDSAASAREADDAMKKLDGAFTGLGRTLSFQLAGPLAQLATWGTEVVPAIVSGLTSVGNLFGGLGAATVQIATGHFGAGADIAKQSVSDSVAMLRAANKEPTLPQRQEAKTDNELAKQTQLLEKIANHAGRTANAVENDDGGVLE